MWTLRLVSAAAPPADVGCHGCCSGVDGFSEEPPAKPLAQKSGLSFAACQALCVAHPDCRYMNYVEPVLPTSGCSIWADCGVLCITDHCWHWWVTYIYEARPGPAWNVTACDALPEGPPPPPGPQAVAAAVTKHIGIP